MGIWDDDGFANDEALDWLAQLDPADGLRPLRQVMQGAITPAAPALDLRQAAHVLVAVELIAAASGSPHPGIPRAAHQWRAALAETVEPDDLILATRALDLVGTSSALAELWSQRAEEAGWHRELDSLRMRLTPPSEERGAG